MIVRLSSKGQIVLPTQLREQDRIRPGQEFEVERVCRGHYRLTRRPAHRNEGLIDLLLHCPVKGYFTPIESEPIDNL